MQPAFEQLEDADAGQRGIDGKFSRSTNAGDQGACRRDPVRFGPLQPDALSQVAEGQGVTPMQVALAWLLHRAPNFLRIRGTSLVGQLRDNLAAVELELSTDIVAVLNGIGAGAAQ